MKQLHYYIFAAILSVSLITESCKGPQVQGNSNLTIEQIAPDSIVLIVHALDLTEDMSSLSSKNDEVVVLIYEVIDSVKQVKLGFSSSFVLVKQNNRRRLAWVNSGSLVGKVFTIIMIERDTDDTNSQIEGIVRSKYFEIKDHFLKQGNFKIEKYLGDNDIIGIKTFQSFHEVDKINFEFKGVFKLDRYNYQMILSKN